MAAASVGVDRVTEAEGCALDLVDDPLRPHVEELDAPELAPSGFALEDRLVEQRALRPRPVGLLPPQRGHGDTLANLRLRENAFAKRGVRAYAPDPEAIRPRRNSRGTGVRGQDRIASGWSRRTVLPRGGNPTSADWRRQQVAQHVAGGGERLGRLLTLAHGEGALDGGDCQGGQAVRLGRGAPLGLEGLGKPVGPAHE